MLPCLWLFYYISLYKKHSFRRYNESLFSGSQPVASRQVAPDVSAEAPGGEQVTDMDVDDVDCCVCAWFWLRLFWYWSLCWCSSSSSSSSSSYSSSSSSSSYSSSASSSSSRSCASCRFVNIQKQKEELNLIPWAFSECDLKHVADPRCVFCVYTYIDPNYPQCSGNREHPWLVSSPSWTSGMVQRKVYLPKHNRNWSSTGLFACPPTRGWPLTQIRSGESLPKSGLLMWKWFKMTGVHWSVLLGITNCWTFSFKSGSKFYSFL